MVMVSKIVFQDEGIIDVTRFDATPENPEIGYMCGGTIYAFSDGRICIHDGKKELEEVHINDVCHYNANINSHDPDHQTEIQLMTQTKSIRIAFADLEAKYRLVNALDCITSG